MTAGACALAVWAAGAGAEFRYIPPAGDRPSFAAVDLDGSGALAAEAAGEPPREWRIEAGDTLRGALGRWGEAAGVEVLFLTDRGYRLHEPRAFAGTFAEAAAALFFGLSHLPHPPTGELAADGRSLAVMHRSTRTAADGDDRAEDTETERGTETGEAGR